MLGQFNLNGIPPGPRGVPKIEVTFDVDRNGIMTITAIEKATGKTNNILITNNKDRLTETEIEKLIKEAEINKAQDD